MNIAFEVESLACWPTLLPKLPISDIVPYGVHAALRQQEEKPKSKTAKKHSIAARRNGHGK